MKEMRAPVWLWLLAGSVVALFFISLTTGRHSFSLWQTVQEIVARQQSVYTLILLELRLPRSLVAIIVGATLGLCGAAMQGLLRNPLASPGLLGSSSGAALFAVIVLYFGFHTISPWLLPIAGMMGALLALVLVYALTGNDSTITTMILAGVAINAIAAACISLAINLAPSPYAVREIALWTLGDLSKVSLTNLWLMLPTTLIGWMMLAGCGQGLNALSLGEQTASSMGVNVVRLRWRIFLATALAVGAAVATVGAIGFIGLVIPHLLRPLVGYEPRRLLFASALGGAVMLLLADIAVRLIPSQIPLQVGVLTALVGAPFFLYLIVKSRKVLP